MGSYVKESSKTERLAAALTAAWNAPSGLDAALILVGARIPVIPVVPTGKAAEKRPATGASVKAPARDTATVRALWTLAPDAEVAIVCGGQIVALDGDGSGAQLLARLIEQDRLPGPVLLSQGTPSCGRHVICEVPQTQRSTSIWKGKGQHQELALKGASSYVVLYRRRVSSMSATVGTSPAVPDVLPWERGRFSALKELEKAAAALASMPPDSGRNDALNTAAFTAYGRVAAGELDEGVVHRILQEAAARCELPATDVDLTLGSARRAGLKAPLEAPASKRVRETLPPAEQAAAVMEQVRANAKLLPARSRAKALLALEHIATTMTRENSLLVQIPRRDVAAVVGMTDAPASALLIKLAASGWLVRVAPANKRIRQAHRYTLRLRTDLSVTASSEADRADPTKEDGVLPLGNQEIGWICAIAAVTHDVWRGLPDAARAVAVECAKSSAGEEVRIADLATRAGVNPSTIKRLASPLGVEEVASRASLPLPQGRSVRATLGDLGLLVMSGRGVVRVGPIPDWDEVATQLGVAGARQAVVDRHALERRASARWQAAQAVRELIGRGRLFDGDATTARRLLGAGAWDACSRLGAAANTSAGVRASLLRLLGLHRAPDRRLLVSTPEPTDADLVLLDALVADAETVTAALRALQAQHQTDLPGLPAVDSDGVVVDRVPSVVPVLAGSDGMPGTAPMTTVRTVRQDAREEAIR